MCWRAVVGGSVELTEKFRSDAERLAAICSRCTLTCRKLPASVLGSASALLLLELPGVRPMETFLPDADLLAAFCSRCTLTCRMLPAAASAVVGAGRRVGVAAAGGAGGAADGDLPARIGAAGQLRWRAASAPHDRPPLCAAAPLPL